MVFCCKIMKLFPTFHHFPPLFLKNNHFFLQSPLYILCEAGNLLPKAFIFNVTNQTMRIEFIESEPWFICRYLLNVPGIGKVIEKNRRNSLRFSFYKNYCIFEDIYQYLTLWKL